MSQEGIQKAWNMMSQHNDALMLENEELKRAEKKKNTIEPKAQGGMTEGQAADVAAPALTSALAQLRARLTTAQGGPPK